MAHLPKTLSGQPASSFAFGTMQFGQGTAPADSPDIFDACRDAGINVFDTAFGYTGGASESILGGLIQNDRDDLVIMTKCAHPGPSNRDTLTQQVETSRQRLNIDVIDVLFLHRWDPTTPLSETIEVMANLVANGTVRSVGVSNFSAWQVMKTQAVADTLGMRIDVIQPMYNLVKRQAEVELLPMALSENIAVTPYSPLAGGLLTGKYRNGQTGRITDNPEYASRYREDWTHDVAASLTDYAADATMDPATLAVAWAAKNPAITAPLISGRNLVQLQPSLDAISFDMSDEMYGQLSAMTRTPPPATDRLEETS